LIASLKIHGRRTQESSTQKSNTGNNNTKAYKHARKTVILMTSENRK